MRAIGRKWQTLVLSGPSYTGIHKAGRPLPHFHATPSPWVTVRNLLRAEGVGANLHTHVTSQEHADFGPSADFVAHASREPRSSWRALV